MRKIKWGVMGTAYIFERDTARGMSVAEIWQHGEGGGVQEKIRF